jgi:hypothetical protein
VHAAALAPADAGGLAAELGQQGAHVGAARDRVPVVAIVGDHVVVLAHQADGADADRFLSDVQVEETADLSFDIELGAAFFEPADEQHLAIKPERLFFIHDPPRVALWTKTTAGRPSLIPYGPI